MTHNAIVWDIRRARGARRAAIRRASSGDEHEVLRLVRALADYERAPAEHLFGPEPRVFAHVAKRQGRLASTAIWFFNLSTGTRRHGIYLEGMSSIRRNTVEASPALYSTCWPRRQRRMTVPGWTGASSNEMTREGFLPPPSCAPPDGVGGFAHRWWRACTRKEPISSRHRR